MWTRCCGCRRRRSTAQGRTFLSGEAVILSGEAVIASGEAVIPSGEAAIPSGEGVIQPSCEARHPDVDEVLPSPEE